MRNRAVFLDKDGTLVENVAYNIDPDLVLLTPGAGPALTALREAGYRLVVVSNQSGVARGFFAESDIQPVRRRMEELLRESGAGLDGFYYCPHHPSGVVASYAVTCGCRKPEPGMLLQAARDLQLDLDHSWLIGDILDDIEAGHAAGCRAILIANGNETVWRVTPQRWPDFMASDMMRAACHIIRHGEAR